MSSHSDIIFQAIKTKNFKKFSNQIHLFYPDQSLHQSNLPDYEDHSFLSYAIYVGFYKGVECLLHDGVDHRDFSQIGYHPLELAASRNRLKITQLLLSWSSDPNRDFKGRYPLHSAALRGHHLIITLLLKYDANPNVRDSDSNTPLMLAAERGHTRAVRTLLANGGDVNVTNDKYQSPLEMAMMCRDPCAAWASFEMIMARESKMIGISLHQAVKMNHPRIVQALLARGFDPNQRAPDTHQRAITYPLHIAAAHKQIETIKILLDAGANCHLVDLDGWTPLHWYVIGDSKPEILKLLITAGSDVNAATQAGQVPIDLTTNLETVRVLLQHGADPNGVRSHGLQPINEAIRQGQKEKIELLLAYGADLSHSDPDWFRWRNCRLYFYAKFYMVKADLRRRGLVLDLVKIIEDYLLNANYEVYIQRIPTIPD